MEVDACDVGWWGACAYQMLEAWLGPPEEEGTMRVEDMGVRLIIMWISKGWTTHELKLQVFYREALARLLALEKFRNLIETKALPYTQITNLRYLRTVSLTRGNSARGSLQRYPTYYPLLRIYTDKGERCFLQTCYQGYVCLQKDGTIPAFQARSQASTRINKGNLKNKIICRQRHLRSFKNHISVEETKGFIGILHNERKIRDFRRHIIGISYRC